MHTVYLCYVTCVSVLRNSMRDLGGFLRLGSSSVVLPWQNDREKLRAVWGRVLSLTSLDSVPCDVHTLRPPSASAFGFSLKERNSKSSVETTGKTREGDEMYQESFSFVQALNPIWMCLWDGDILILRITLYRSVCFSTVLSDDPKKSLMTEIRKCDACLYSRDSLFSSLPQDLSGWVLSAHLWAAPWHYFLKLKVVCCVKNNFLFRFALITSKLFHKKFIFAFLLCINT